MEYSSTRTMTLLSILAGLLGFLGPSARGQDTFPGEEDIRSIANHGNGFCHSVSFLDLDEDGVPDLVFGEVFDDGEFNSSPNSGAVLIVSGILPDNVRRSVLTEVWNPDEGSSTSFNSGFGKALACSNLLTGTPVLMVGAPSTDHPRSGAKNVGAVYLFSGRNLNHIATAYGEFEHDRLGTAVANGGDIDGDGFPDFIAGAPGHDGAGLNTGRVYFLRFNPITESLTSVNIQEGEAGEFLGKSLAGEGRYLPESTGFDVAAGGRSDRVRVFSPVPGASTQIIDRPQGKGFGAALLFSGDHNDDGFSELLVSDPVAGSVSLHTFSQGSASLWVLTGASTGESRFGSSLTLVDDLTGDGIPELAVGAPDYSGGGKAHRGAVTLFEANRKGTPPRLLWSKVGAAAGDRMGSAIEGGTVLDRSSRVRQGLLVASPVASGGGVIGSGTAFLYSLRNDGDRVDSDRIGTLHGTYSGVSTFGQSVAFRRQANTADDWLITSRTADVPGVGSEAFGEPLGQIALLSGSSTPAGKVLRIFRGKEPGEGFGTAATSISSPPFNGNDHYLVVGASRASRDGVRSGVIRIFNLETGEMTFEHAPEGAENGDEYGHSVARLGSIFGLRQAGISRPEQIAIGAPGARIEGARDVGKVYIYTMKPDGTLDLETRKVLANSDPQRKAGDRFGSSLAGPMSLALPEMPDPRIHAGLIVGAPYADLTIGNNTYVDAGRIFIYGTSRNFSRLQRPIILDNLSFPGDPTGDLFGYSVSGAWDLASSGGLELVVGSPLAECGSRQNVGRVTVYTYLHAMNPYQLAHEDNRLAGRILIAAPFQDHIDDRSFRSSQPRRIQDLGRTYMLPLVTGRPQ